MVMTLMALGRLFRVLGRALADPATRGLMLLAGVTLAVGTLFYAVNEGWSALDALYFSVVTLTTIGFGDLVPSSGVTKVFTIVYSLLGIGIIASIVASLAIFARNDGAVRRGGST